MEARKFGPAMLFIFSCRDNMNSLLRVCVKRSAALNDRPSIQKVLAQFCIIPERWKRSSSGNCFKMYGSVDRNSCPLSHPYTAGSSKTTWFIS